MEGLVISAVFHLDDLLFLNQLVRQANYVCDSMKYVLGAKFQNILME